MQQWELLIECGIFYNPKDINNYFRRAWVRDTNVIKEAALIAYMTKTDKWDLDIKKIMADEIRRYKEIIYSQDSLEYTSDTKLLIARLTYLIDVHPEKKVEIAKLLDKVPEDILEAVYINEYYYFDLPITSRILLRSRSERLLHLIKERSAKLKTVKEAKTLSDLTGRKNVVTLSLNSNLFQQLKDTLYDNPSLNDLMDVINNCFDWELLKDVVDKFRPKVLGGEDLSLPVRIPPQLRQYIRLTLSQWKISFLEHKDEYNDYKVKFYPYINVEEAFTINDLDRINPEIYPDSLIYRLMDEMYSVSYRVTNEVLSEYPINNDTVYYFLTPEALKQFVYDQIRRTVKSNKDYYHIHINAYQDLTHAPVIRIDQDTEIKFIFREPIKNNFTKKEEFKSISPLMVETSDYGVNTKNYFII